MEADLSCPAKIDRVRKPTVPALPRLRFTAATPPFLPTTTPTSSSSSSSPSTQPCTPSPSPSLSPPTNGGRGGIAQYASRPSPSSYNKLIKTHVQNREPERALNAFSHMLRDAPSLLPDSFTFPPVFKACAELAALGVGEQAHCWALKTPDVSHNVFVLNSLMHMYGRCGEVGAARKVFERMPSRNVVSWNSLIGGYVRNCLFGEAMDENYIKKKQRSREN